MHPWNDDRQAPFAVAPLSRLAQRVTVRARSPASLYEARGEKMLEVFEQRTSPLECLRESADSTSVHAVRGVVRCRG